MDEALRRRSILLASPDRDTREVIADCLEAEGAHIYEATNREEALLALRDDSVDALIIDLLLPGEHEVLQEARQRDPALGVLTISEANGSSRTGLHRLDKPFERERLLRAVHEVLPVRPERSVGVLSSVPEP